MEWNITASVYRKCGFPNYSLTEEDLSETVWQMASQRVQPFSHNAIKHQCHIYIAGQMIAEATRPDGTAYTDWQKMITQVNSLYIDFLTAQFKTEDKKDI